MERGDVSDCGAKIAEVWGNYTSSGDGGEERTGIVTAGKEIGKRVGQEYYLIILSIKSKVDNLALSWVIEAQPRRKFFLLQLLLDLRLPLPRSTEITA